ncbi:MAG: sensor domain-containing diguanylate cyclase [Aeromonas sp.]|uniref:sensor domain-containing diguanylate cyclase n=1 Tax=Aeromonas sp. TaxID=647 RepID=UPI003F397F42
MNNIISKDLNCNTQLNISFGVIMLTLIASMATVSCIIKRSAEQEYHGMAAMFVHNMATQFIEQQFKPLEYILNETSNFIDEPRLEGFLNEEQSSLRTVLIQTLSINPNITSIVASDLRGHFNTVPFLAVAADFDATTRPWYRSSTSRSLFVNYSDHYTNAQTGQQTVSFSQLIVSKDGYPLGTLAMDLNLEHLSYPLRQLKSPIKGEFYVVDRAGDILLHSDVSNLFRHSIDPALIGKMTNGEDHLHDPQTRTHLYYYSFSNPDWFVIYTVSDEDFKSASRADAYLLLIVIPVCLLICLLCWGSLRNSYNKMIIQIVAMMRVGRIDLDKPDNLLRQEIQHGHDQMQEAITASTTDALTGLFNRRSFDQDLRACVDNGQPFFLGIVDLDNFKAINDQRGHLMGDTVLQTVAQEGMLVAGKRANLYRYGGEELAILIPGHNKESATTLLERWRQRVATRQWRESDMVVTFSAGLGQWRQESITRLIEKVDQALYEAKHNGKDRIHHAD